MGANEYARSSVNRRGERSGKQKSSAEQSLTLLGILVSVWAVSLHVRSRVFARIRVIIEEVLNEE